MNKNKEAIKKEFAELKNKMIDDMSNFYRFLEIEGVPHIKNYPNYLPFFDEFIYQLSEMECSDLNFED